jgi:hypothetical protein
MSGPNGYVHVIMPIGSDPDWRAKQAAVAKGVHGLGLQPRFPNYLPFTGTFDPGKLMDEMRGAVAVIVDLSHERPSCYYELGLAEIAGVPVVAIAEVGTPIHQSAARARVAFYETMDQLARLIEAGLSMIVRGNVKPRPVTAS